MIQSIQIYKFYTDNCPPCKAIEPHLQRLVKEYNVKSELVKVVPINAELSAATEAYGVQTIPTLLFISGSGRNGRVVGQLVGLQSYESIKGALTKALIG